MIWSLKKLRRCAVAGLLAVSLAASLSGCHGSQEAQSFSVPESFDTGKQYELTFWAKNDTNKRQTDIYKQAIEDFQEMYPNITVNLRLYTDYGKIYNDVITNISTGTTPNVCITYPDHIATYLTGDEVVVPLDGLFADETYGLGGSGLLFDGPSKEEIIPQFLEECSINGSYYAVPFMRSTEACYINKTYVEKLGYTLPETLTWDFIWEVSEAAAKKDDDGVFAVNGQNVMIPFIYKSTDNMMIQMLKQKGAGYSTESGDTRIFNDTTKELLFEIAGHVKSGAFSTFKISSYPANFLNAGQCVFAIDSTAGATWMGTDAPLSDISEDALVEFETEVMMIPQFEPENPQMISQGPSVCIFNKEDPQEVLASWLFAQYLLSDDWKRQREKNPEQLFRPGCHAHCDWGGRCRPGGDFFHRPGRQHGAVPVNLSAGGRFEPGDGKLQARPQRAGQETPFIGSPSDVFRPSPSGALYHKRSQHLVEVGNEKRDS